MNLTNMKGNLFLLIATIIWGSTFVAQDMASDVIGPFEFQAVRTIIGAIVLIPVIVFLDGMKKKNGTYKEPTRKDRIILLVGGFLCGAAHCVAACLQQLGIHLGTEAGKSGFITAMYIIFVPIFGLVLKHKIQPHMYGCIVLAVTGLYLLCIRGELKLSAGDFAVLLCAMSFAVHILLIDRYVELVDCVKLSVLQFVFSGILSSVMTFLLEGGFHIDKIREAIFPILFAGVLSCGVAYTLQIVGQKYSTSSTGASIIMSFESVVAVIAEAVVLKTIMSPRELLGCVLMFTAIILSQFEFSVLKLKRNT